jgi:hypothetical protein
MKKIAWCVKRKICVCEHIIINQTAHLEKAGRARAVISRVKLCESERFPDFKPVFYPSR